MTDFNPPTPTLFNYTAAASGVVESVNYNAALGYSTQRSDGGTGGADKGLFRGKAVPASTWTALLRARPFPAGAGDRVRTGLAVYESSTGKIAWVGLNQSVGLLYLSVLYATSLTTYGTEAFAQSIIGAVPNYFKIEYNGTNYLFSASFDEGLSFTQLASIAKTTLFTTEADKIGLYVETFGTAVLPPGLFVTSYQDPDYM